MIRQFLPGAAVDTHTNKYRFVDLHASSSSCCSIAQYSIVTLRFQVKLKLLFPMPIAFLTYKMTKEPISIDGLHNRSSHICLNLRCTCFYRCPSVVADVIGIVSAMYLLSGITLKFFCPLLGFLSGETLSCSIRSYFTASLT